MFSSTSLTSTHIAI